MIEISTAAALLCGAIVALALAGSAWLLFAGLRASGAARAAMHANARFEALLAAAPASPILAYGDGRIELTTLSGEQASYLGIDAAGPFKTDQYRY